MAVVWHFNAALAVKSITDQPMQFNTLDNYWLQVNYIILLQSAIIFYFMDRNQKI